MSTGLANALLRHLRRDPAAAGPSADAELVRRFAAQRDEAAFEELIRRHGPLVWGVCRRALANRSDAEDAFQSTFLVLARRAGAVRNPAAVGCWLYGVAHRVARRMRGRSLPTSSDAGRYIPSPAAPVAESLTVREFLAALDEELLRLPERYRRPLVLCFLQERTQDEAARQLGVSLSTLKRRLDAGRELLRERLSRRGVELSAALAAVGLAVPAELSNAAVRAAVGGAAGVVSTNVIAVTEGVVRAMYQTKLRAWAAGLVMASAAVGGTGYFAYTGFGQGPPAGDASTAPKADKPTAALNELEIAAHDAAVQVQDLEARLKKLMSDRAKAVDQDPRPKDIARLDNSIRLAEIDLDVARTRLKLLEAQLAALRRTTGDPDRAAEQPEVRKLREEMLKAAKTTYDDLQKLIETGDPRTPPETVVPEVYEWSKRVMELERELDRSPEGRQKAAREHFDRMKYLERYEKLRFQQGVARRSSAMATTYYRLEAELWLKEAEAKPAAHSGVAVPADAEQLRAELERARLDADTQRQRNDRLESRIQQMADELEKSRRGSLPLPLPRIGEQPPAVPEGFRGTVMERDGSEKDLAAGRDVLVKLTPGQDAGLRPGAVLTVHRSDKETKSGRYLGTVTVISANAKDAVGRFRPAAGRRATVDDLPKPGDELIPNIR